MENFAITITKKAPATLADIKRDLKTEFKNFDYMQGYLDGYLFHYYKILTLEQLQDHLNNYDYLESHVIFVTVNG